MSGLLVALQYLLPQHLLGRWIHALARSETGWLKNLLIAAFMRAYRPTLGDALQPDPRGYASFNAFFTRALRADARPVDPDPRSVLSPCDGAVSVAAAMHGTELLQAKGRHYRLEALLAGQAELVAMLQGGPYVTLYLAPTDYHRLHMPVAGRLRAAWHVPGRLFAVNRATSSRVGQLYARNERVICAFESEHGPFALVLVGALFVGSMQTIWHGPITPAPPRRAITRLEPSTLADLWQPRAAEFGRFNMGSTVILLLPPGGALWPPELQPGLAVRVGTRLGVLGR